MENIDLGGLDRAFTRGGNRLCFIDPREPNRCIKVLRPDRSPEIRWRQKNFLKRLRPVSDFDENLEEFAVWNDIAKKIGEPVFSVIPRCYGFVNTNHGQGLVTELVRDADQKISKTVKQYLWEGGLTDEITAALERFSGQWKTLAVPSKKLLLHNMLLQKNEGGDFRVWVIDGLGWSSMIPLATYCKSVARYQSTRKIDQLWMTVEGLLDKKQQGQDFGYHGWLKESQRTKVSHG